MQLHRSNQRLTAELKHPCSSNALTACTPMQPKPALNQQSFAVSPAYLAAVLHRLHHVLVLLLHVLLLLPCLLLVAAGCALRSLGSASCSGS
jgi:hypothetical protein